MYWYSNLKHWEKVYFWIGSVFFVFGMGGIIYNAIFQFLGIIPSGGTYTEVAIDTLDDLNPLFVYPNTLEADISSLIFSGLLRYNAEEGAYKPDLAETLEIKENGTLYEFVLRKDRLWHDGAIVSVEDILFTFELLKKPETKSIYLPLWQHVSIERQGDRTIAIKLKQPDIFFEQYLSFPILPKHLLQNMSAEQIAGSFFSVRPIGAGPYEVIDIRATEEKNIVKISPFEQYPHTITPNISLLQFEFLKDASMLPEYANATLEETIHFEQQKQIGILAERYQTLFFNTNIHTLRNYQTRKALSLIVWLWQKKHGKPISSDSFQTDSSKDNFENFVTDNSNEAVSERIREILYESGWRLFKKDFDDNIRRNLDKQKFVLNIATLKNENLLSLESLITDIRSFGIDAQLHTYDIAKLQKEIITPRMYDILVLDIDYGYKKNLVSYLHSSQRRNTSIGKNYSQYSEVEIDVLLEDYTRNTDPAKVSKILWELEKRYDTSLPFVFIEQKPYILKYTSNLEDVSIPSKSLYRSDRFTHFGKWYVR